MLLLFLNLKPPHAHVCALVHNEDFFSVCALIHVLIVRAIYHNRQLNSSILLNSDFQDWNQRPPEAGTSVKSSTDSSRHSDDPGSGALSEPSQINPVLVRSISLTGVTVNGVRGEAISGQSDQHAGSVSKSRKQGLVFSEHDGRNGSVESSK